MYKNQDMISLIKRDKFLNKSIIYTNLWSLSLVRKSLALGLGTKIFQARGACLEHQRDKSRHGVQTRVVVVTDGPAEAKRLIKWWNWRLAMIRGTQQNQVNNVGVLLCY